MDRYVENALLSIRRTKVWVEPKTDTADYSAGSGEWVYPTTTLPSVDSQKTFDRSEGEIGMLDVTSGVRAKALRVDVSVGV